MAEERSGLLIAAIVAIVAIVGLVILFQGARQGTTGGVIVIPQPSQKPCFSLQNPLNCDLGGGLGEIVTDTCGIVDCLNNGGRIRG